MSLSATETWRLSRHAWLWLVLALAACGGGEDEASEDPSDGDAAVVDAEPPVRVPYRGQVPPLPEGSEVDGESYFPTPEGGVWRYRRQAQVLTDLPPVEQGGETTLRPGEEENELVRRTVTVIDLEVEGEETKVNQIIEETFVIEPSHEMVGPNVKFKNLKITEREIETQRFVRELNRRYLPPYTIFSDTWKTGRLDTLIQTTDIRLIEDLQLRGMEEATHNEGLIDLKVETDPSQKTIPIEGRYRDKLYEVKVFDDFSGAHTRTYWLEQATGPVQWQFRDTNNIIFTLTETNLE